MARSQTLGRRHQPHPFAAAAGDRLHEDRVADRRGERRDLRVTDRWAERFDRARHDRNANLDRHLAGAGLAAHPLHRLGGGADEREPGVRTRAREAGVLRQEAVAGMDRRCAGPSRHVHELVRAQVALRRRVGTDRVRLVGEPDVQARAVAVRGHGDGRNPQFAAGANHADGDFATVGNQDLHARQNTSILALCLAAGAPRLPAGGWRSIAPAACPPQTAGCLPPAASRIPRAAASPVVASPSAHQAVRAEILRAGPAGRKA